MTKNSTCKPNCFGKSCGDDGCGGSCGSCAGGQTCANNTCVVLGSHAQFVSQSAPSSMAAGQTYSVSVTMKNTGTTTWTAAASYKLGSQNPQDNGTWGNGRQILAAGDSIASGQSKTFTFNVVAPATPGTYNFQWQMLQEYVQWFGDKTPNVAVTVTSFSQVSQCVNNACSEGLICKDGNNCCQADQCGYDAYPNGQCVDSGGTRSQGPLATNFNLVCRSGVWKSMANSWGCNYFACDSGTCLSNVCPAAVPACVPKTCASLGNVCGSVSDGCGGTLNCGNCSASPVANSSVVISPNSVTNINNSNCQDNSCPSGSLPVSTCTPKTCDSLIYNCGTASDGCGGTLQCGTCPSGQACTNNKCVTSVSQCSNNTCSSGLVCKDGNNCCQADQCGYDVYPNGQCVDSGGTRSQGPLATNFNLVCRSGVWKTVSGAWGCNYFACDVGPCLGNVCLSAGQANNFPATIGSNLNGLAANVSGAFYKVDQDTIIFKINEIRAAIAELEKQLGQ